MICVYSPLVSSTHRTISCIIDPIVNQGLSIPHHSARCMVSQCLRALDHSVGEGIYRVYWLLVLCPDISPFCAVCWRGIYYKKKVVLLAPRWERILYIICVLIFCGWKLEIYIICTPTSNQFSSLTVWFFINFLVIFSLSFLLLHVLHYTLCVAFLSVRTALLWYTCFHSFS